MTQREEQISLLLTGIHNALAALERPAIYPPDVERARNVLRAAIEAACAVAEEDVSLSRFSEDTRF